MITNSTAYRPFNARSLPTWALITELLRFSAGLPGSDAALATASPMLLAWSAPPACLPSACRRTSRSLPLPKFCTCAPWKPAALSCSRTLSTFGSCA